MKRRISSSLITLALLNALFFPAQLFAQGYIGELVTKALPDGRKLELVEPYGFIDAKSRQWGVPAGTTVDGASIPAFFWSFIGGPFSGKYRDASVIHDFYCDTKHRDWRSVHRVFLEAMLVSGVSETKAKLMYFAVYRFGPRWEVKTWQPRCPQGVACMMVPGIGLAFKEHAFSYAEKDFQAFSQRNDIEKLSLQEIESLAEEQIALLDFDFDDVPVTHKEFYDYYQNFPEDYEGVLNKWEQEEKQAQLEWLAPQLQKETNKVQHQ